MNEQEILKSKTQNDIEIFENAIKKLNKDEQINIILHDIPDPDAISCGFALKTILNLKGFNAEIYHKGEISHAQNLIMYNILHISLNNTDETIFGTNICVDCTPKNSCVDEAYMIIDHHENNTEAEFIINHADKGACATIIWNIVKNYINDMTEYKALATALLIGIRTDTKDMSSENISNDDFIAWQELYQYSDTEKVQKIINYDKPRYYYEKLVEMNKDNNSIEKDGIFIGGIGLCSSKQRDVIAMLADEYLRMSGISTTIIFTLIDCKYIEISMRSNLSSVNVKSFLNKNYGEKYSGGTSFQGGAKIPISDFFNILDNDEIDEFWSLLCRRMFKIKLES